MTAVWSFPLSTTPDDAATDLLIREVDEDLRQDQMNDLWKRYSSLFYGIAIAIVVSVAVWQVWQNWQTKRSLAASDKYVAAIALIDSGKKDEALKDLAALSQDGTSGYRLLAKMKQADILVGSGDLNGALAIYQAIGNDSGTDQMYRDMVKIKAAYLGLDTSDPAVMDRQVEPLTAESSSWRFAAREILALDAIKRGESTRAVELYKALTDDMVAPQGIRARAAEMLKILQPKSNG